MTASVDRSPADETGATWDATPLRSAVTDIVELDVDAYSPAALRDVLRDLRQPALTPSVTRSLGAPR